MNGFGYFSKAFKTWSFRGRARRREYWYYVLFQFLIVNGLYVLAIAVFGLPVIEYMEAVRNNPNDMVNNMLILYGSTPFIINRIVALIFLIPGICVYVRRLHDTGRSGWWFFINFIPLIGPIVGLVFLLLDGNIGTNKYGEDPKQNEYPANTHE